MKNYPTAKDVNRKIVITVNSNKTLARIFDDKEVISSGVATCSYEDTFDFKTGAELALARAFEKLPKPSNVEWKVVKRRPEPGDHVRIVAPCFTFDRIGDILKVNRVIKYDDWYCVIKVRAADHANRDKHCMLRGENYEWNYSNFEVEVVEPVTKEEWRVVNRAAKAGDYVRITCSKYSFDNPNEILKVHDTDENGHITILIKEHRKCKEYIDANGGWWRDTWVYLVGDFEVVEKVEPYRKINRIPRPGDYVRIFRSAYDFDTDPTLFIKVNRVSANEDGLIAFYVKHTDHPLAKKRERRPGDGTWCYAPWCDEFEFYEKLS